MGFGFKQSLAKRKERGLLRRRKVVNASADGIFDIEGRQCINFASNDYLGLSQHPDVLQSYVEGLSLYGAGSTASSVVCGYMRPHQELEDVLGELLNKEAVMLCSSGFAANQAICQAMFSELSESNNSIVCDKLMHASFIEGALNSNAKLMRYKHNDIAHFQQKLASCAGNTLVATEGVFSMDGDLAELKPMLDLLALRGGDNSQLLIDDAHGFGVIGEAGAGLSGLADINGADIDIVMATFGKAIGTGGAFIAGSTCFIEFLVNFAKHFVYSTAPPPAQAYATIKSIKIMQQGQLREKLGQNIALFKHLCHQNGLADTHSDTAIQPIAVGNPDKCVNASDALLDLGIYAPAIRTPTVAAGSDRLRVTLSATHQNKDIESLVDALCIVRERQGWAE
jgi:8-amino-7-oxononanoate synthase